MAGGGLTRCIDHNSGSGGNDTFASRGHSIAVCDDPEWANPRRVVAGHGLAVTDR
ncbi:hypothetical protein [Alloactinosynnema sp. L-07]|nr:hypothetical protein [Alloactinosynnema sp. L-07]